MGHLPTEFWSSLDSSVGYNTQFPLVIVKQSLKNDNSGKIRTGNSACSRI